MKDGEEMITITKKEYDELVNESMLLAAIESSGVDISYAYEILEQWEADEDDE